MGVADCLQHLLVQVQLFLFLVSHLFGPFLLLYFYFFQHFLNYIRIACRKFGLSESNRLIRLELYISIDFFINNFEHLLFFTFFLQ